MVAVYIIVPFIVYLLYVVIKWEIIFLRYGNDIEPPDIKSSAKLLGPPSEMKPYIVDALVNKTLKPSGRSVSSTILELMREGFIEISYKDKFNSTGTRKRSYFLQLNDKKVKEINKLPVLEKRLLAFVFQGKGSIASFEKIKSLHIREASSTRDFWKFWEDHIVHEMMKMGLIDKDSYYIGSHLTSQITFLGGLSVALIVVFLDSELLEIIRDNLFLVGLIVGGLAVSIVLLILFRIFMLRRSAEGHREFLSWLQFKQWMEDFAVTKNYPIDSLILWEKYLVYGLALGVSEKALSQLPIKYDMLVDFVESGLFSGKPQVSSSLLGGYETEDFVYDLIEFIAFIPKIFGGGDDVAGEKTTFPI
jgi:uncharacterized membrane protein